MRRLKSERLILRQWLDSDRLSLAKMNADPEVMRFFETRLSKAQSDVQFDRLQKFIASRGWGFWAVENKLNKQFLGFVGLNEPSVELPFSPCVEIGWRLVKECWGQGYATEAAKTALEFAFETLDLQEVVSFTASSNLPSIKVMQSIGMSESDERFMHPSLPKGHYLAEHVLYRLAQSDWRGLA